MNPPVGRPSTTDTQGLSKSIARIFKAVVVVIVVILGMSISRIYAIAVWVGIVLWLGVGAYRWMKLFAEKELCT